MRGFVPVPKKGRLVGRDTACVRVAGRTICADGAGRFGRELEGRLPINGGSLVPGARPCVGMAGRELCAEGVGRFGSAEEGSSPTPVGTLAPESRPCAGAPACGSALTGMVDLQGKSESLMAGWSLMTDDAAQRCAESEFGRSGRETGASSAISGGCAAGEGRVAVGAGRRADESMDEEGRIDVAVECSLVELRVVDAP